MRLVERLLLLSSTYRDLRDREQRSSEEVLRLRTRCEELETKLDEARVEAVHRERDIADRFMPGARIVQVGLPAGENGSSHPQPLNVHQWKKNKAQEFMDALSKRRETLVHKAENAS